ncbi:uncharacterized protein LOC127430352 [Myxocyprinus asiaticus]|uniref:uncharacterized protein LOC127430352 n=1 Tax=Myxocyprinus asiaticus TaxID=70543 RepID=UPI0022213B6C|nr:uncharacterized protein LOC127430352 [Myxocyprinus asiaticus]XP_051536060.1 uncharacterized protein LOC127430352 [Myxocyprinus asiaticus]
MKQELSMVHPVLGLVVVGVWLGVQIYSRYGTRETNNQKASPSRFRSRSPDRSSDQDEERKLRDSAQKALKSIGLNLERQGSRRLAGRGQHVFNNGLLDIHRSVLQDLLSELRGYDQLDNLLQDVSAFFNQDERNAISNMVAYFSLDEFYVDYNAEVFGVFVRELRRELVAYLKVYIYPPQKDKYTSVSYNRDRALWRHIERVQHIVRMMVEHEVYVDTMARDRWLQSNTGCKDLYEKVRQAVDKMLKNIIQDFKKVADKIKLIYNNGNWP